MATESSRLSKSCANRVKFSKLNASTYNLGPCLDTFVVMFFSKVVVCVTLKNKRLHHAFVMAVVQHCNW